MDRTLALEFVRVTEAAALKVVVYVVVAPKMQRIN